jgi:hypothetical protein
MSGVLKKANAKMIAMVMIMMSENRQKLNCIAERIEDNQHKHE